MLWKDIHYMFNIALQTEILNIQISLRTISIFLRILGSDILSASGFRHEKKISHLTFLLGPESFK